MIKKNKKNLSKSEEIINYVLLGSAFIAPLIFFLWIGHISIAAVGANIHTTLELTNEESNEIISIIIDAWNTFKIMAYEYIIYCVLLILNYIFYKKKYKLLLLIFNVIILIALIIDFIINFAQNGEFYNFDLLLVVFNSLIGLYYAYRLYKE